MDSIRALPPILQVADVWPAALNPDALVRPLFAACIPAGFPSPADDYVEKGLDVARLLLPRPSSTYFFRLKGESLSGHWIRSDDIAVVDTSISPKAGMVVIAVLDGEVAAKQLEYGPAGEVLLVSSHKRYKTITVQEGQDFFVWGVVTWTLHRHLTRTLP